MLEPLLRGTPKSAQFLPAPIDPSWIEAGDPRARCAMLASTDDRLAMTVHWECTAGRFTWLYDMDETIFVLEGGCTLNQPGLPEMRLGPGDSAHFSRGAKVTWTVDSYVRKIGFCKSAPPRPIGLGIRLLGSALRRITGASPAFGGEDPPRRPNRRVAEFLGFSFTKEPCRRVAKRQSCSKLG